MANKYNEEYRRMSYLMEKIRVMIAKNETEEYESVFYGYIREARECIDKIVKKIEE